MINELVFMNGYGLYVWSAFGFTLICFTSLYAVTKIHYIKEISKKINLAPTSVKKHVDNLSFY